LVTMIIVLNGVGQPVEYIGLVLSVDWLVDRFGTAVNIFGDCVGAVEVERTS
ncbi:MAG: cation:dicarboxylase symporter family transporter, partial [Planctomycetes bacterium]|nr:cation:dicarboxylase symporter family transporter [Planctomycetota bacterium]